MSNESPVVPASSQNHTSRAAAARALIALTPVERNAFLRREREAELRALLAKAEWCNPEGMTANEWLAVLTRTKPEVLVSCWKAPRLPEDVEGLRYVCHFAGSVRALVPRALIAGGLKVTNWGGIAAPIVAEHALLLVLGALRSVPQWAGVMKSTFTQAEKDAMGARSLIGKRVSIHGFGQIARQLIRYLQPFNVQIMAFSEGVPNAYMTEHGAQPAGSLKELAARADVFVTCEALTEKTRKSLARETLAALPVGSVFVNVGRGAVVDEAALAAVAIERGLRLATDVYCEEPLPQTSPLHGVPHALFSPHIGGPTTDMYPRCGTLAIKNIERYFNGQPLENEVTLEIYDRST